MLVFAVLILGGLLVSLFVPRRRMWVKAATRPDGASCSSTPASPAARIPGLEDAVASFADTHAGMSPDAAAASPASRPPPANPPMTAANPST